MNDNRIKTGGFKSLCTVLLFFIVLISSADVWASTFAIAGTGSSIKILKDADTDADYMEVNPANSSGISVNQFSDFIVSGKNLRLLHGGYQGANYNPAKLIVIAASRISIAAQVELIGQGADILFIDTNSSVSPVISCTSCGFANFGRVTLAAATSATAVSSGMSSLGKLTTFSGGSVQINSMNAAGIQSLELIAEKVTTAGEVNTHLRGDPDPNGGFKISPSGNKIIASAGINLYAGSTAVIYETLEVTNNSGSAYSGVCELGGTLKAAMINVVATCPLKLNSGAVFSTLSDIIATTEYRGQLTGIQEGIYLQTNKAGAGITLEGKLLTDNVVQLVAVGGISLSQEIKAYSTSLFAKGGISINSSGLIASDIVGIGAEWFSNQGSIQSETLEVETAYTIYNHFGGKMRSRSIKLVSESGAVVNGSRTNKANMPVNLPPLALSSQLVETNKYGVYQQVSGETGTVKTNLSATIAANSIQIKAKRFENINPYGLVKPDNVSWESGVDLNVASSRRVYLLAETKLQIDAPEYVLNSSAIMGLNQTGSLDVNTRLLMNQRYRVEAQLGVLSRISYSSAGGVPSSNATNVAVIQTYLTAYSSPGILFSFGELMFSDGEQNNPVASEFVNQFSFLEVLADANFHETTFQSIGLMMATRAASGYQPIRCAAYGCSAATYKSLIEFETLTSFSGRVRGISSELIVKTVNQLDDASKQIVIDRFVEERKAAVTYTSTHINPTGVSGDVTNHHYVSKVEIAPNANGQDYLHITLSRCMKIEYYHGGTTNNCAINLESYSVANLLSLEAGNNLLNGLPWTANQVETKGRAYISAQSRSGSLAVSGVGSLSGQYVRQYTGFSISADNQYIVLNYVERFVPQSQSLSEAQGRAVGAYLVIGSVELLLSQLMGSN